MSGLTEWATRHGVSRAALAELVAELAPPATRTDTPESVVQQQVRLAAAQAGLWLSRNNCGALADERGVPVRFGLANESPAMSKRFKSGDLIGIDPRPITLQEVGRPRGRFVSIEIKRGGWRYAGRGREAAQMAWATHVQALGGVAGFAAGVDSFVNICQGSGTQQAAEAREMRDEQRI